MFFYDLLNNMTSNEQNVSLLGIESPKLALLVSSAIASGLALRMGADVVNSDQLVRQHLEDRKEVMKSLLSLDTKSPPLDLDAIFQKIQDDSLKINFLFCIISTIPVKLTIGRFEDRLFETALSFAANSIIEICATNLISEHMLDRSPSEEITEIISQNIYSEDSLARLRSAGLTEKMLLSYVPSFLPKFVSNLFEDYISYGLNTLRNSAVDYIHPNPFMSSAIKLSAAKNDCKITSPIQSALSKLFSEEAMLKAANFVMPSKSILEEALTIKPDLAELPVLDEFAKNISNAKDISWTFGPFQILAHYLQGVAEISPFCTNISNIVLRLGVMNYLGAVLGASRNFSYDSIRRIDPEGTAMKMLSDGISGVKNNSTVIHNVHDAGISNCVLLKDCQTWVEGQGILSKIPYLKLEPNKKYLLCGDSGSGKSTMAAVILNAQGAFGKVFADGFISFPKQKNIGSSVHMLTLDSYIPPFDTIFNASIYPAKPRAEEVDRYKYVFAEACKKLQVQAIDKLDTLLLSNASAGQKSLLQLAGFYTNIIIENAKSDEPHYKIIVLDNALRNLDEKQSNLAMKMTDSMLDGHTILAFIQSESNFNEEYFRGFYDFKITFTKGEEIKLTRFDSSEDLHGNVDLETQELINSLYSNSKDIEIPVAAQDRKLTDIEDNDILEVSNQVKLDSSEKLGEVEIRESIYPFDIHLNC